MEGEEAITLALLRGNKSSFDKRRLVAAQHSDPATKLPEFAHYGALGDLCAVCGDEYGTLATVSCGGIAARNSKLWRTEIFRGRWSRLKPDGKLSRSLVSATVWERRACCYCCVCDACLTRVCAFEEGSAAAEGFVGGEGGADADNWFDDFNFDENMDAGAVSAGGSGSSHGPPSPSPSRRRAPLSPFRLIRTAAADLKDLLEEYVTLLSVRSLDGSVAYSYHDQRGHLMLLPRCHANDHKAIIFASDTTGVNPRDLRLLPDAENLVCVLKKPVLEGEF